MDRREFVKSSVAVAALALTSRLPGSGLQAAETAAGSEYPDLVAVRNGEPVAMFRKAIEEVGGIGRFVKPGQKVVVKPNIGWDQPPEMGANTHPDLVAEIVRQCLAAGAASVDVFDNTCNEWRSCYRNSGIAAAVEQAGGKMHSGKDEGNYVEVECPQAKRMKKAKIHRLVRDCDVLINVPVLKHHGGAKMTCAMKNYMGIVWDRGFMHKNNLSQCIADSLLYRRPDLNVVDAYRVMKTRGPRGVSANDVVLMKYLLLSTDPVAVDVAAARTGKFPLEELDYLKMGEEHGLGTTDLSKLKIKRLEA